MNWTRFAISAIGPFLVALPIAALFWRRQQSATMGTVVGAGIVLISAVFFMALEFGEGVHYRMQCAETNVPCGPSNPSDFVRIFSYAFVGMIEVMAIFIVGAAVESRMLRRHRAPEWQ
jgi:hypothetical protein